MQPHGYELLQYDWPDAVFVHRNYSAAFPCLSKDFMRNYWIGFHHAREHYSRFTTFVTNKTFVASVTDLAQVGCVLSVLAAEASRSCARLCP